VLAEARNGVISFESARRDYGVAIDRERWTVDEAPAALRRGAEITYGARGHVARPERNWRKRSIRTLRMSTAPVITFW
jgi:hypothetical protein